jgi:hypothetical protein
MLPWYLRPIQPSRFAFLGPPLLAIFFLAWGGAAATFLASAHPSEFQGPMCLALGAAQWALAAWASRRRRREGGRRPAYSSTAAILCGAALIIMAIPALVWPHLPRREPVPSTTVITQTVCWWAVGVLMACWSLVMFSHRHQPSERLPS